MRTPTKDTEDDSAPEGAPEEGRPDEGAAPSAGDAGAAAPLPSPFREYTGPTPAEDGTPPQGPFANGHGGPFRPGSDDLVPEPRIAVSAVTPQPVVHQWCGDGAHVAKLWFSRMCCFSRHKRVYFWCEQKDLVFGQSQSGDDTFLG
jgi:hypothetical protein